MYSIEDLSFIIYNNRSINGVVRNFIPRSIDGNEVLQIENILDQLNETFQQKFIEVSRSDINENAEDIFVYPSDIHSLGSKVLEANLNDVELNFLLKRGITSSIIDKWNLRGLSSITEYKDLVSLNATCHPLLSKILEDGLQGGGIMIPLFHNKRLINCAIRKISDIGKLKYTLACPDIDVWGLEDIENEEVYITEGLFDMMAIRSIGLKAVSVSSAMWSGIQLYRLIHKNPKSIIIFCDNDNVGIKTGFTLSKFFDTYRIQNKTVISKFKDASEHIFQNGLGMCDVHDINIDISMIQNGEDFNFLDYLKNRKFS